MKIIFARERFFHHKATRFNMHATRCSNVCSMFIALFALRRIISNICCSNQFLLCALNVPLAMLHRRYKIFLPSPLLTIQLFIVGLIIAIGLASITGFVKKKVCREKRFRWEGRDGSCGRAGIYYSYASFDSYHRLLA